MLIDVIVRTQLIADHLNNPGLHLFGLFAGQVEEIHAAKHIAGAHQIVGQHARQPPAQRVGHLVFGRP